MADSYLQTSIKKSDSVDAGSTKIVDILSFSKFNCIEYLVCFDKGSSFQAKTLNLKVYRDDTNVCSQVYGRNSAPVSVEVNASGNGGSLELSVKNNETTPVSVRLVRTII